MEPVIDVLICSYNEAEQIPALLDSLVQQSIGVDRFTVIFVDNRSTDNTREIVEQYRERLKIQYILEENPGKSFALNTGYQLATAEYVAQIDADCKADPRWLENILKVIEEEKPDLCGGPYYPYYGDNKPKWYKDEYNSHVQGEKRFVLQEGYYVGFNMIWRKDLVLNLGGHNIDLGINPSSLAGGEDTEIIDRARYLVEDFKIIYDPDIIVFHYTKDKFYDLWHLIKRSYITGYRSSKIFHSRKKDKKPAELRLLMRVIKLWLMILGGLIKNILVRDRIRYPFYANYIHEQILPLLYLAGENTGLFYLPVISTTPLRTTSISHPS
jgi:glycosyltransferase involved in cell wall biosynthesis